MQTEQEIIQRLTHNEQRNIFPLDYLPINPDSLKKGMIYRPGFITIRQKTEGGFIAGLGFKHAPGTDLFLEKSQSIDIIKTYLQFPYLQYTGTREFKRLCGTPVVLPVFKLLYYKQTPEMRP